jgi:hypothetical protein
MCKPTLVAFRLAQASINSWVRHCICSNWNASLTTREPTLHGSVNNTNKARKETYKIPVEKSKLLVNTSQISSRKENRETL